MVEVVGVAIGEAASVWGGLSMTCPCSGRSRVCLRVRDGVKSFW